MSIISADAEELIIEQEVTSEAVYRKKYHKPTWPGLQSGVTVGIGYDLGQSSIDQIRKAWSGLVPADMLAAMVLCAGMTGNAGHEALDKVYNRIDIPWETALHVFRYVDTPKWVAIVKRNLPNCDLLSPDCLGALVSLAYNRGPSFSKDGDRYREMRAIKAHMQAKRFDLIPNEFRSMVRLWQNTSSRGLVKRRNAEADLFERGLKKMSPVTLLGNQPDPVPLPTPRPAAVDADAAPKVSHELPYSNSVMIRVVKQELSNLGYHEFGNMDGEWGGRTVAAIAAFKLDRHVTGPAVIDDQLMEEIDKAKAEGWTRPMADFRKDATVKDLAAKGNVVVKAAGQNKFIGYVTAIGAAVAGFFKQLFNSSGDAVSYLSPIKDFLGDIPMGYWLLALIATGAVIVINSNKSQSAQVTDYKQGKLL